MMGMIRGDLEVVGISNLLQLLSTTQREGYLTLRRGGNRKMIHLGGRGLRLVSGACPTNPLGRILVRSGRVTPGELRSLLAQQRLTRMPLGEIITRRGLLTPDQLKAALQEQVAEEIYELFTWTSGEFEFNDVADVRRPRDEGPLSQVVLGCGMMKILLEAARRVDELAAIKAVIPDDGRIAERAERDEGLDDRDLDHGVVREILAGLDGRRTVGEMVEFSIYPRFKVLRTLYELVVRGAVRIRAGEEAYPPGTCSSSVDAMSARS